MFSQATTPSLVKEKWTLPASRALFVRSRLAALVALILGAGAMARYPGGTPLDHTTERYSFSRNFLSDLGMTVAYDGRANLLGAALLY